MIWVNKESSLPVRVGGREVFLRAGDSVPAGSLDPDAIERFKALEWIDDSPEPEPKSDIVVDPVATLPSSTAGPKKKRKKSRSEHAQ